MTVSEFYRFMCEKIPLDYRLDNDFDGMSCCPDPGREVTRVLCCLDATPEMVAEAEEEDCQVILTHHPMLYGGIRDVLAGDYRGERLVRLIKSGISVMSFHTRLDGVPGGVSDTLAGLIGVGNTRPICEKGIARLGVLDRETDAREFAGRIKEVLGAPFVEYADAGRPIRTVAVGGGSVNSFLRDALAEGADAFVGGEIGFHNMTDLPACGLSVFAAGHFYTENPVCARLFEPTAEAGLLPVVAFSNSVGAV